MNRFYFNTGVRPESRASLGEGQVWRGGTKQIPFDADAPAGSVLMFLAPHPDMQPEASTPGILVRGVFNTTLLNRYAYFYAPKEAV